MYDDAAQFANAASVRAVQRASEPGYAARQSRGGGGEGETPDELVDLMIREGLVVAGLRPGWQADYDGAPPIYEVAALCKMSQVVRLDDGRYNLLATGMERVRVVDEPDRDGRLYRSVEISPLRDAPIDVGAAKRAYRSLRAAIRCLIMVLGDKAQPLADAVATGADPQQATFAVAALLARTPMTRQALLEERDVVRRCDQLTLLASELLAAASGPLEGAPQ